MEIKAIHFDTLAINGEWCDCATVFLVPETIPEIITALREKGVAEKYSRIAKVEVVFSAPSVREILEEEQQRAQALAEENKALSDRLNGVIPPPEQGALWDAQKNYINGDVVKDGGDYYKALKYSRGKRPSNSPEHWAKYSAEAVQPIGWESIEMGANVQQGTVVTHAGKRWKCKKAHVKKNVNKPAQISDYWQEMT